jgi:hypothetical protein
MASMSIKRFFLAPSEDLVQLSSQFRLVKETLRRNGSYLPATPDEPPEETQPYDADRTDDDSNFDRKNLCDPIEEFEEGKEPYVNQGSALLRTECNFFKFFLDGSIRTYYLGEQIEDNRSYPLIATEVASAAIKRADDGRASVSKLMRKVALLVPPSPPVRPQTVRDLIELRANFSAVRSPIKLDVEQLERDIHQPGVDLRTSLLGKARAVMHEIEHTLARSLKREKGEWLILDGAIRRPEFLGLDETIGLAKSFSRNPVFHISGRFKDVVAMLSGLKEGARTVVFRHSGEGGDPVRKRVAFWYLRLRSGRGLQGPLQGIVKIDYRSRGDLLEADDIELVNTISRALLAEKYVSPYPTPRWHAHIYPIYVAENYIKSSLFSPLAFRGHFGGI